MNINELCVLFDRYEIVESKLDIDKEYYTIIDSIYTDGSVKTDINKDGYIHILSVHNASYLIFIDTEHKIYLRIYKHIDTAKFKYIKQKLQILKNKLAEFVKDNKIDIVVNIDNSINNHIDNDVIDINTFTCTECNNTNNMIFTRSKTNPEAIETRCDNCKTEYVFVPSKYYKLSSKKTIYFKSETSSRQIEIIDK